MKDIYYVHIVYDRCYRALGRYGLKKNQAIPAVPLPSCVDLSALKFLMKIFKKALNSMSVKNIV